MEPCTSTTPLSEAEQAELDEILASPTIAREIERRVKEGVEREVRGGTRSALRTALYNIIDSRNPGLEAACVGLAIDFPFLTPETVTTIGKKYSVTKAAVSKRLVAFCKEAGLPPSTHMKSEESREKYRNTNHRGKPCQS